jgi:hypothetical protein
MRYAARSCSASALIASSTISTISRSDKPARCADSTRSSMRCWSVSLSLSGIGLLSLVTSDIHGTDRPVALQQTLCEEIATSGQPTETPAASLGSDDLSAEQARRYEDALHRLPSAPRGEEAAALSSF